MVFLPKRDQVTLPEALLSSLDNIPGFNRETFEAVHAAGHLVNSVRLNPAKLSALPQSLIPFDPQPVPWSTNGYYLDNRPSYIVDPLWHGGAYYVQEASSMFLEHALKQVANMQQPLRVLDLCAAPGGKSTLLQSVISAGSCLVSNEVIKTRGNILSENITRWGAGNVIITNNDPKDFQRLPGFFDVIVVDAPCSGSGLFRRDADAISEWSENNVALCSQRQQRILSDVAPALKEGGVLIYSTCSYSREEDEMILDWMQQSGGWEPLALSPDPQWQIVATTGASGWGFGYRFYPDKLKGEGFFIAAFRKVMPANEGRGGHKLKNEKLSKKEAAIAASWMQNGAAYSYIKQDTEVIALPAAMEPVLAALQSSLYIKKAGVKLGTIIRDELVPDHELAQAIGINGEVNRIAADKALALQYLRREEMNLPPGLTRGWTLMTYENTGLGWVKVLPNRINNYYPTGWRILNK